MRSNLPRLPRPAQEPSLDRPVSTHAAQRGVRAAMEPPPTLSTPGFTRPCPAQGTRFTGPRPTLPVPSDWLLQVSVILGRFGLVDCGGGGLASGSVGRAGTRMCVVAAAEELEGELRGLWMRRTRRPR